MICLDEIRSVAPLTKKGVSGVWHFSGENQHYVFWKRLLGKKGEGGKIGVAHRTQCSR